jgi:hypothetical protein
MNFSMFDLGQLSQGQIVEVKLTGSPANVRLMDSANFNNYRTGRQHRYIGGLIKQSPYRIEVPKSAHWIVTIDMNGLRGSVNTTVNVLPVVLPNETKAAHEPKAVQELKAVREPAASEPKAAIESK